MPEPILLYSISSGSCLTQSYVPTGVGKPRLFDPSDIYVYRCAGALLVSRDGGGTWINILPSGIGSVSVIAQTVGQNTSSSIGVTTYVIGRGSTGYLAKYQNVPEGATWTSGSAPPASFVPEDAAADIAGDIGILVGNIASVPVDSRVVWASSEPPFELIDSDAGIPQTSGSAALITDIEICE